MSYVSEPAAADVTLPGSVSVELLSAIVDNLAQPVFAKDRTSRFVLLNRAFCELVGHSREEMLGKRDDDFFPEAEAAFFRRIDERVFETGIPQVVEEEPLTDARGARRHVRTVKSPLRDASGLVTHLVGVIVDMSQMKASEAELRAANEKLERAVGERTRALEDAQQALLRKERLAVLGQLAGGLAHQIRNPLAAMQTATAVLRRKLGEHADEDVHQALNVIREEVWEANRIITDLIDYARVKPPSRSEVSVERLLGAVLESAPPPPRITVAWDLTPGVVVRVDERQTRDALGNIVRNAFEAMPQGGTLSITSVVETDHALVSIEDTGPGLTRDSIQRLFEPLVTSKPLGLGLGLSTARALVENQGGTIRCATTRGIGARFEVRLPLPERES